MSKITEQGYKQFEANRDKIKKILGYKNDLRKHYPGNRGECIQSAFNIMSNQLNTLMSADEVPATDKERNNVNAALQHLLRGIINEPLTDFVRDLTIEMGRMAFNWNKFIGKRNDMENMALAIQRIARQNANMADLAKMTKELINRGQAQLQYKPPAWELSRHYLLSLEEFIEDEKPNEGSEGKVLEYTD